MKLKTLKDFELHGAFGIDIRDLKQEAIKWVKFYRNECKLGFTQAKVLTDFLNITDEDLK